MHFNIEPYVGVGPIRFGMSPEQVRNSVGGDYESFRKTPYSEMESDIFSGRAIVAHYSSQGGCEAVEFGGAAVPTFQGKPLLHVTLREVFDWLKSLDQNLDVHETGLTSKTFGFGVYMSSMEEEDWDEPTEGVIVFARGLYD